MVSIIDKAAERSAAEVKKIETCGTAFLVLSAVTRCEIARSGP